MKPEHAHLLARLERFELDSDGTSEAFVRRLARENAWSLAYARRACVEYKRFVFLAVTTGHPCTPSDQVDQVWHLHLLHAHAYEAFCRSVLRAPLPHTPSRGGGGEREKFRDWYRSTLDSYRASFGHEPPADLWPEAKQRFSARHVRVDRRSFFVLPKPGWWPGASRKRAAGMLGLAAGSLFAGGCTVIHGFAPFSFTGPRFLSFFFAVWIASLALVAVLRRLRTGTNAGTGTPELDPHEVAYLAGGEGAAAHAAIAALVHDGYLELDQTTRRLRAGERAPCNGHPLELAIYQRCARDPNVGASVAELRLAASETARDLEARLERHGLLVPRAQRRTWLLLALLAPGIGAVKLAVGLALDKPVGYLFLLCALSTFVALWCLGGRVQPTAAGRALLERLRNETPRAEAEAASSPMAIALAVGLFGTEILAGTALADVGSALSPVADAGSGSAGGDGDGGCGGGGCGCGGCG